MTIEDSGVSSVRETIKRILPMPVRQVLRGGLNYAQRNLRWPIILWQVRGVSVRDQITLLLSAMAAPYYAFHNLLAWQDPILLRDAEVVVPGVGKFALRARTDDLWHVVPWREQSIASTMRSTLLSGDVFIDAGANIGIYTVLASRLVGPSGRVVSIEMMPDTADRLEAHVRMNQLQNVAVIRHALSDVPGQVVRATVQEGKHGQATIASDSDRYGLGREVEVETTTLDAVTAGMSRVRLIKIDVEGAELMALHGAPLLLQKLEAIVYESWGWKRGKEEPVDELLKVAGFTLRQLDGNNWIAVRPVLR